MKLGVLENSFFIILEHLKADRKINTALVK